MGLHDVVLVSIDFESTQNIMCNDRSWSLDAQVGLAILDTCELGTLPPTEAVKTFSFVSCSPEYIAEASEMFLFGTSTTIGLQDTLASIDSVIPRFRSLVLVGQSSN